MANFLQHHPPLPYNTPHTALLPGARVIVQEYTAPLDDTDPVWTRHHEPIPGIVIETPDDAAPFEGLRSISLRSFGMTVMTLAYRQALIAQSCGVHELRHYQIRLAS
jgi:hypothetical protein